MPALKSFLSRLHQKKRFYELAQVAVKNGFDVPGLESGPVVLYHSVRMEHVGAYLAAPPDLLFRGMHLVHLFPLFLLLELVEPRFQDFHGCSPVLVLGAFVLAADDYPRRHVGYSYRGIRLVNVLPACSARPVGIHPQVFLIYLDHYAFVDFRGYEHRRERSMPSLIRVERGYPD